MSRGKKRQGGWTITEVFIVVAVVGVLLAVAIPNLTGLFVNNKLDAAANEFMTSVNFARSEAIRRGTRVRMENASGGTNVYDWTPGWSVFVVGSGEVLRVNQPLAQPLTLFIQTGTVRYIEFAASGGRTEPIERTFVLCHQNQIYGTAPKSRSRGFVVSAAGAVRLADIDSTGRPLKPSGAGQAPITSCTAP